jgi:hypothetical protein
LHLEAEAEVAEEFLEVHQLSQLLLEVLVML